MHSNPLVLAVDDDPDTLALLRVFLTCERFSVATASNAAQAMEVVLRGGVDAVVTDLAMPETDGGQLIQRIRAAGIGIPVVVTSGQAFDRETKVELLRIGACHVFEKPCHIGFLADIIRLLTKSCTQRCDTCPNRSQLKAVAAG